MNKQSWDDAREQWPCLSLAIGDDNVQHRAGAQPEYGLPLDRWEGRMKSVFNQHIDLPREHLQVLKSCSFPAPFFLGAVSIGRWEPEESLKQIQLSGEPTTFLL